MANAPSLALLAILAAAAPARALEVSLEENRAQRGSVGYVDLQRIFRLYPETQRAKQSFAELLRQAEEQVNLKRAGLISLRAEIAKLNLERDLLQKAPFEVEAPVAPPRPAGEKGVVIDIPGVTSAPIVVQPSSGGRGASGGPPAPGAKPPLVISIPGVTSAPIVVQPPPAPAAPPRPADDSSGRRQAKLKEMEQAIADKIAELSRQETAFKEYEAQSEKSLLELESRRSEMLLGKIYGAVREVARESSVSVVVDKSQILFGQNTVDLTEKVLKKLEGSRP